ncbi:MAG TPA: adenylate/guanylate cyclase domain-containing protein [Candidatus Limnocylindria bacterium]|nr:adenylate/guanylate cyclase domain-containing protein [Candidatus Limnocylindria bacterium]
MNGYSAVDAAARAGVQVEFFNQLLELGLVRADPDGLFDAAEVRKAHLIKLLEAGGIAPDDLASVIRSQGLSLDFIGSAGYRVFALTSETTFSELAERNGLPVELLLVIREAMGGVEARPDDLMRDDELEVVPLVELQLAEGLRPIAIERTLRVYGDSLRRIAEAEAEWWRTDLVGPMLARGLTESDVAARAGDISPRLSIASDRATMAIYHAQQRHAWTTNIVGGIAGAFARAGLRSQREQYPAMCFLDITGYTRLTQEQGDEAAAGLATKLSRLVQRTSLQFGGRAVKWLGDGVMLHFPDPGQGVVAALEMVGGASDVGLPPAHVGLHSGPVIFQEGDFYGQTVNMASRIGEYARPGEVLVSQEVVDAAADAPVTFREIGPVELKGVPVAMRLHSAHRGR